MSTIAPCPPPWTLKGDVYLLPFFASPADISPDLIYDPLEASSPAFADPKPAGGLAMVQIIRYSKSPVGPYDELVLVPGYFAWEREDKKGRPVVKKNPRVTRIYVSQEETCYNGRSNWNIPKHLAAFSFTTLPSGALTINVTPHGSSTPFFTTTFKPTPYLPALPFTTATMPLLGFTTTLVQPPLPAGATPELPGTDFWRSVVPLQKSRACRVGWFDMRQGEGSEQENFWPSWGRWRFGFVMRDAEIKFGECEDEWEADDL